jgi:hypothetical protein
MAPRPDKVKAADAAYTAAVQAAAGGHGTWEAVQAAKHAVHQAVSAAYEESLNAQAD